MLDAVVIRHIHRRRSCASVHRMALQHLDAIRAPLFELQRLVLAETVTRYTGDRVRSGAVPSTPILLTQAAGA